MAIVTTDAIQTWATDTCNNVNTSYGLCNEFLTFSPFSTEFTLINNCIDIVQDTALVLATLFFLIEFFSKTIQLEWVKWENIVMLFAKLFVAKALIDNSSVLMAIVYDGFSGLQANLNAALGGPGATFTILPTEAVAQRQFFISDAEWDILKAEDGGIFSFSSAFKWLQLQPTGLILSLVMVFCQIVVLGRVFELMVYTIMSPLPLATFTSSATNDVGKTFLKSYCAVCLQAFILIVMFAAFAQLMPLIQTAINNYGGGTLIADSYGSIVALLLSGTLAMGVFKSGAWAKKICGTA